MSDAKHHLWREKKPVTDIIKSGNLEEVTTELKKEQDILQQLIKWLSGAYSNQEVIAILNTCGFDENDLVAYGFKKDLILSTLNPGTELIDE
jgi:hypothetical protein